MDDRPFEDIEAFCRMAKKLREKKRKEKKTITGVFSMNTDRIPIQSQPQPQRSAF
jgi:hypothetical protein